jgi:hypothetical protein
MWRAHDMRGAVTTESPTLFTLGAELRRGIADATTTKEEGR